MDSVGSPDPLCPPRLVGEVLGTVRIPDELVDALLAWFRVTWDDGGLLSAEIRSGRGLHALLRHITSGVEPVSGLERLALLGIYPDVTVHIMY